MTFMLSTHPGMKLRLIAAAALLAALVAPSAALAERLIQCTVGYTAGDETVVLGISSTDTQRFVQSSAAKCDYLISTREWKAADMYRQWDDVYDRVCLVTFNADQALVVWTGSDDASVSMATSICSGAASDYKVVYY